jgi:hypothetical protein
MPMKVIAVAEEDDSTGIAVWGSVLGFLRRHRNLLIGLVALALTAGGTWLGTDLSWSQANTISGPRAANPQAAVRGYLEAVSRGEAAAALSYAASTPANTKMLTDAVLADSLAQAPITNISVDEKILVDSVTDVEVGAHYDLGGTPVETTYLARKVGSIWRVVTAESSWPSTSLLSYYPDFAWRVNGVLVDSADVKLFPGSYLLTSADPRFKVDQPGPCVLPAKGYQENCFPDLLLTDEGAAQYSAAVRSKLSGCLSQQSLAPVGCGFSAPADPDAVSSTIKWSKVDAKMVKALAPSSSVGGMMAHSDGYVMVTVTYRDIRGAKQAYVSDIYIVTGKFKPTGVDITFNRW